MKILVTGGAGFIGSHVVDAYIQAGHEVAIIDDLSTGREENVNPQARFYRVDVSDFDAVMEVFEREKPEMVNHHAAQANVRFSVERPVDDTRINVLGTVAVLEAARRVAARKFIFASTGGAIYGETERIPTPESEPPNPCSHYGTAKLAAEKYCQLYGRLYGLRWTILRYANVYGPRQNPKGEAGVTAIFARLMLLGEQPEIFGDGTKTRDYVHVFDVVRANVMAIERGDREILNIGTGREIQDIEVFRAIARHVGYGGQPKFGPVRPGELLRSAVDPSKAASVLGWKPTVRFEEGVASVVEYQRQQLRREGLLA